MILRLQRDFDGRSCVDGIFNQAQRAALGLYQLGWFPGAHDYPRRRAALRIF